MSQYTYQEIKEKLQPTLSPDRYEHTLGVMYTAGALAMRYGADVDKAMLAGLLHDCAKGKVRGIAHAPEGAKLAETEYGVTDREVLSAIACHTTGKPRMSLLEKIIYIADYMEPHRDEAPNLGKIRALAFSDIDTCLLMVLKSTLDYLKGSEKVIDPMTEETYMYYINSEKNENHL